MLYHQPLEVATAQSVTKPNKEQEIKNQFSISCNEQKASLFLAIQCSVSLFTLTKTLKLIKLGFLFRNLLNIIFHTQKKKCEKIIMKNNKYFIEV